MEYYTLTKNSIPENIVQLITRKLNRGAVIGYPTETVYGLGCDALNPSAVKRIYTLKGRDYYLPFIVLVHNKLMVNSLTTDINEQAEILMDAFWPGPLTIILKASSKVPRVLTAGRGTIGLRISSDPICMKLLNESQIPLVSTSANPTGSNPATSAEALMGYFNSKIDIVIDAGLRNHSPGSTIIDLSKGRMKIIRKGAITSSQIYNKIKALNE